MTNVKKGKKEKKRLKKIILTLDRISQSVMCPSNLSIPFPTHQLYLPMYQISTQEYHNSSTLKVVVTGYENYGFFISEGFEGNPDVRINYIETMAGISIENHDCVGFMSLYDLKNHLDEKLKRFAWNNDVIKQIHLHLEKQIDYHNILMFRMRKSAKKIQQEWRSCISDPSYSMCKKRLMKEYGELLQEI